MGTLTPLAAHNICTKDAELHLNIVGFAIGEAVILFLWANKYAGHIPIWSNEEGGTRSWKLAGEWCNREHAKGRYWGIRYQGSRIWRQSWISWFSGGTKAHEMLEVRFLIYRSTAERFRWRSKGNWRHAGLPNQR